MVLGRKSQHGSSKAIAAGSRSDGSPASRSESLLLCLHHGASVLCCRPLGKLQCSSRWRRRHLQPGDEHQDFPDHRPRYRDFGQLEGDIAAVVDDPSADLDSALTKPNDVEALANRPTPYERLPLYGRAHRGSGEYRG